MRLGPHDLAARTLIIAELGINHNGSDTLAHQLIEAAKAAGADAAKFQMFRTNALIQRRGPEAGALRQYELPASTWTALRGHCGDVGLTFLASVFDEASAFDYLNLDPVAVKIGSGELHALDLVRYVARWRLPMILSTGMATLEEVQSAVGATGDAPYVLLHCVSAYPAPLSDVNLKAMDTLRSFRCPVGYSDHTLGTAVAVAAVARGACIIEKHLTLDCAAAGPDHRASADPKTFAAMVSGIRQMEQVLGDGRKRAMPSEVATRTYCRAQDRLHRRCPGCQEALPATAAPNRVFCAECRAERDAYSKMQSARRPTC